MNKFERIVHRLSEWFDGVARMVLVITMLLVVVNILLRAVWKPIGGTYDYVTLLTGVLIPFALAYCALKRGFPAISILVDRLPQRTQAIVDSIVGILSIGFFAVASWRLVVLGTDLRQAGEVLATVRLPFYPLVYGTGFCCLLVILVLFVNLLKSLAQVVRK
jgi:TRAP-type C4-dicarboxylate transport system permease small subunit